MEFTNGEDRWPCFAEAARAPPGFSLLITTATCSVSNFVLRSRKLNPHFFGKNFFKCGKLTILSPWSDPLCGASYIRSVA